MATTSDFSNGIVLRYNGELYILEEYQHRTPGNLRAFVQAKLRSIKNGRVVENRFRSGEEVEIVRIDRKKYQYLYRDGSMFVFMDNENYEQIHVEERFVGEQAKFLKESDEVEIMFNGTEVITVSIPLFVALKIVQTDPGVRGDTATGGSKPAKVETGAMVQVPLFLNEGDVIKIDTRTSQYLERVKQN